MPTRSDRAQLIRWQTRLDGYERGAVRSNALFGYFGNYLLANKQQPKYHLGGYTHQQFLLAADTPGLHVFTFLFESRISIFVEAVATTADRVRPSSGAL
jgi:hypothetical protein